MSAPQTFLNETSRVRPARRTLLESRFRHCVHTYHGVQPFSADGQKLLYIGFDDIEQSEASIVVRDLDSGEETVLASTNHFDYHVAAKQFWCLDDQYILFRTRHADGPSTPMLVPADRPGEVEPLTELEGAGFRHVADDGVHAYGGRVGMRGDGGREVICANLRERTVEKLFDVQDVLAIMPDDFAAPDEPFVFNHTVCNADQTRLFCKFLRNPPWKPDAEGMNQFGAFVVCDLQTRKLRSLGYRISGHPAWLPGGREIVNVMMPLDGSNNRWFVRVDAETGDVRRILDSPIEGPGHPLPSPVSDTWVVTDAFTADGVTSIIYLINMAHGAAREIARLDHRTQEQPSYDPMKIHRAHPHPAWSPDGRRVVCNCNHDGERMQLLMLDEFFDA